MQISLTDFCFYQIGGFIGKTGDFIFVKTFEHDTHKRFCSRKSDKDSAVCTEFIFNGFDFVFNILIFVELHFALIGDFDVDKYLRVMCHKGGNA